MTDGPSILLVAPDAPPKSGAEAIQVGRVLAALDRVAQGTLVTTPAGAAGWTRADEGLAAALSRFGRIEVGPPWPRALHRVATAHRLRHVRVPDEDFWLPLAAGRVLRALARAPDIIYSRSMPLGAALLGRALKRRLGLPWIMHLSDPWVGNDTRRFRGPFARRDAALEAACVAEADLVAFTTPGQARIYGARYPGRAGAMIVTPNVMPGRDDPVIRRGMAGPPRAPDGRLRLVFAGNLYGRRPIATVATALRILAERDPQIAARVAVDVYGNAADDLRRVMAAAPPALVYHGPRPYREATAHAAGADIAIHLEPLLESPFGPEFLPSKITDHLAMGVPTLGVVPPGSETWRICEGGHGWAVSPDEPETLAALLARLADAPDEVAAKRGLPPPDRYEPDRVVADLLGHMRSLLGEGAQA